MKLRTFCPKCGKNTEELIESICKECYLKSKKLLEINTPLRLEICNCGRINEKNRWILKESLKESISEHILKNIKADSGTKIKIDCENRLIEGKTIIPVTITASKGPVKTEVKTSVTIITMICPDCSRLSGGYFETTMQLRGKINKIEEVKQYVAKRIEDLKKATDLSFICGIDKVNGGYDLKIGSAKVARKIAREVKNKYDMDTKESFKQWGVKNGKDIYRATIAVKEKD